MNSTSVSSTLFTLKQSWHQAPRLYERLAFASKGDTILLIQDGVLALNSPLALGSFLAKCGSGEIEVVALADDCELRGVKNRYTEIKLVGYEAFVELVARHGRQVSW